jgi:VWFA-related protein
MKPLAVVFAALGVVSVPLADQQTIAPSTAQPLFRASIDSVRVDVVVTDKDDKPVTDLSKAEFAITENGRPQAIMDFQYVSVPVAHRSIDVTQPQPPEPDVASNMPPTPTSRLFVMVIDDLHLIEHDIVPIKRVMTDFIASLSPDDEVALVFVGRSDLSVNFTQNTGRLLAAIEHVRAALGFGLDALAQSPDGLANSESATSGVILTTPSGFRLNYARSALMTLRSVATSLAGSGHSRRAIVYVSGGTTLEAFDKSSPNYDLFFGDELLAAFDTARRADVPIYTLDPRGGVSPEEAVRGGIGVIHSSGIRSRIAANIQSQQTYMSQVALNTGGRAFINASDLTRAIHEIVGENGSYYLLGYSPDPVAHDGEYHSFDVKVTRPGVRVRARQGYMASAPGPATTDAKPTLDTAMRAGVNVSGLSLRGFVAPIAATAKGMNAVVTMEVTYPAPVDGSRRIDDTLQMTIVAMDPDAKVKAQASQALHFAGTVPPDQNTVTFLVDDIVALPSQPLTVRLGVASQTLGKAGTVQLPVDVVKPTDSRLQWSGLLIGFTGDEHEAAMRADVIKDLVPFQPTTTRTFSPGDSLRIFGRVFWGAKDLVVDVTVSIQGSNLAPQNMHIAATPGIAAHREAILDTTVRLTDLASGSYTLRVDARLPNGQTARRDVAFTMR